MKRDLARMESETHDVLVIGGGIVGAAVAHDAALRGFSVALVERDDFCGATSAANAKIIHGGFRYLGQLDAAHVKQFVRERRALETIAPHLVEPVRFVLPIFKDGALGAFFTRVEMTIYDRLSGDKARLDDLDRRLSQGYFVERDEIRVMEPHLDSEMLDGAIVYQECRVWSPERLVLEFLAAACGNRAHVANYAEVKELLVESKTIKGARVIDRLTGGAHDVKARVTINCAGPFADDILDLANAVGDVETGYSQGLNVITRAVTSGHGVTTRTPDGRPLFVVPWRGMSVIGTHDMPLVDGVSSFRVTPNDVHRLLTDLHTALPMMDVSINDVTWAFGGVRPTVTPSGKARGRYAVVDHRANMGPHGFLTALGGDFTNSRALAEDAVNAAARHLNRPVAPPATSSHILPGGRVGAFAGFHARLVRHYDLHADDAYSWARMYGAYTIDDKDAARADASAGERVAKEHIETLAVIDRAVEREMAVRLDDVIFRRTGLGTTGVLDPAAVEKVGRRMASRLGWNAEKTHAQIEEVAGKLASRGIGRERNGDSDRREDKKK